jgi:crotonobetainyl-CoA:carnitine CoA-transferase CaiB-like acyl-CoA transferase
MRPDARSRLKIDAEDLRAHNPQLIYVRGSGYGARGPDRQTAGYDASAYWSRAGIGGIFTPQGAERPVMQRPAFGDVMGGLTIAGAIAAAMYERLATGNAPIVDVALMNVGMWQLSPDITNAKLDPESHTRTYDRKATWNPIVGTYRTRDARFIHLNMMEGERYWADFCTIAGRPDLIDDPRFVDMPARRENARECVEALDELFASRDYADWCETLKKAKGAWAPFRYPVEVHADPQVEANGWTADVEMINGSKLTLVTSPAQFDEQSVTPNRAPELGEHTETALLELGLSWEEVTELKEKGAIG